MGIIFLSDPLMLLFKRVFFKTQALKTSYMH
jgi:hypothetical protein